MGPPRSSRSRRKFLSSLGGGIALLTGCIGGNETSSKPNGPEQDFPVVTHSIGETFETQSGFSVTVKNPRLAKMVVVDQHTHPVQMAPNLQFILVDMKKESTNNTETARRTSLTPRFKALVDGHPADGSSAGLVEKYHPSKVGTTIGIPVSVSRGDAAAVAWVRGLPKSVTWTLPDSIVSSLASAASFQIKDVSVTDETNPKVTLTVRNSGNRDGTFYANVSGSQVQDGNKIMAFDVPTAKTVTHSERPGIRAPSGEETRVVIDWGIDQASLVITPE